MASVVRCGVQVYARQRAISLGYHPEDGVSFLMAVTFFVSTVITISIYRAGSLPQIQRSVGRGTPSSPTYVEYLPLHLD